MNSKFFHHQSMANLPLNATEIERLLKQLPVFKSFEKKMFFLEKNSFFFQNQ